MRTSLIDQPTGEHSVLIVDDDPVNLGVISTFLEENGYQVLIARDGESGLEKARYVKPGLILLDVLMPGINGFEICNQLKKDASTKDIPVIFITALAATNEKIKGFEAGGIDFITKPFQQGEVLARVRSQLSIREMQIKLKKKNDRLKAEISDRRQAEDKVLKLNEELEQRVEKRTADLIKTNALLNKEIQEKRVAENMLRESEQRYKSLATNVADGIILVQDNKLLFLNDAFAQMFGYSNKSQLIGTNVFDLISDEVNESYHKIEDHFQSHDDSNHKTSQKTSIFQGVCVSKAGRKFWVEGHNSPIKWEGKFAILCTIRDINQRKLDEIADQEHAENLHKENIKLRSSIKDRFRFGDLIGKSPAMQKVYELIISAASSDTNVVIYGESGTGKELVAKAIHDISPRSDKTFVTVNCQAIPENLLESSFFGHKKGSFTGAHIDKPGFLEKADGGDLFLDEVGDINLGMQGKLLRAIEGNGYSPVGTNEIHHSNFRIIAATNKNLAEAVKNGTIREDFYYRIHVVPIRLPPLRERKEDIQLLVDHFLSILIKDKQARVLPARYMESIYNYHWPGNVRELQNALQRFIAIGNLDFLERHRSFDIPLNTQPKSLKISYSSDLKLKQRLASYEKDILLLALSKSNWNRNKATKLLDIPRRTLYHKMKKYGLI